MNRLPAFKKPRARFHDGFWWCWRMGITGKGLTIEDSYNDMRKLYREAVRPKEQFNFLSPRAG